MQNFYNLTLSDLKELLLGLGKESFRAQQLFKWIYQSGEKDFNKMSNLSKNFREELPQKINLEQPKMIYHWVSKEDDTEKFLFDLGEGDSVESVLIPHEDRLTLCVSSEVGCNMGCKFCFTAKIKMKRKLTAGEIVGQFLVISDYLNLKSKKITNLVFMGMGEPLDNPTEIFKSIDILSEDHGKNFSRKKITVSSVGIVPQIPKVTAAKVRLAISLNGVNDHIRSQLMPINQKWPLKELLLACEQHVRASGDKVTFGYVLIDGITDSLSDAKELFRVTRSVPCKINLIPFNEFPGSTLNRPSDVKIAAFHSLLQDLGAHVLYRRSKGRDIYAACGQLNSDFGRKSCQPS